MDGSSELGEFLNSRRAALRPEEVGITPHPTTYKIQASGDFSARYQSLSVGLGTWH